MQLLDVTYEAVLALDLEERVRYWNPGAERLFGWARDEVLDIELFDTLAEAKVIFADWITTYNTEHPHSALDMMPPAKFAARWRVENRAPPPHSARPPGSLRNRGLTLGAITLNHPILRPAHGEHLSFCSRASAVLPRSIG